MKRMLADDQFPDCFERMLGPSYEKDYPELFYKPQSEDEKISNEKLLNKHLLTNLKEYHQTIKDKKGDFVKKVPKQGIGEQLFGLGLKILSLFFKQKSLIDTHHDKLQKVLYPEGADKPIEEIGEELIMESMAALSGIMIGILSVHFREGKQSGFRIPKTLRANWAHTGKRKKRWIWNIKIR